MTLDAPIFPGSFSEAEAASLWAEGVQEKRVGPCAARDRDRCSDHLAKVRATADVAREHSADRPDSVSAVTRCRGTCSRNLTGQAPATQYQRQKVIWNTVRVASSLYSMNLAALSAYQRPLSRDQVVEQAGVPYVVPRQVRWNQMSDRAAPAVQHVKTASRGASSTRHSVTAHRPGALSPGGHGCDIKHGSYDRFLQRLKGGGPLRRGPIPPDYGRPFPFRPADPIYGGKVVKTGIVSDCPCVPTAP